MAGMVERVRGRALAPSVSSSPVEQARDMSLSLDEWASYFSFGGLQYPLIQTTLGSVDKERIVGNAIASLQGVSSVFALIHARVQAFSQIRFQWTRFSGAQPGDLFGTDDLAVLEHPWPGGHTANLLSKMEIDNSIGGNAYIVRPRKNRLARLRPDLVTICLGSQYDMESPADAPDVEVAGYAYFPRSGKPQWYWPWEVAHHAPLPDPNFQFLGMSWLTPLLREVQADALMTEHKYRYFANAATPNLAVKFDPAIPIEMVKSFKELMENEHRGSFNAWKCVTPESEVALWDGRRVRADQVRAGDEVVSWAGGEAVPGMVTHTGWQPQSPIVTVRTQRGRVLRTTPDHPFLARRVAKRYASGTTVLSDEDWADASDLRPGDLVRVGLGWARDAGKRDLLTGHQAWALGALTGDGSLTSSTPAFTAADDGVLARMQAGYEVTYRSGYDYYVRGIRALCVEHGLLGKRSWEKRVPVAVMAGSAKVQAAFISGLLDTDGHVSDPGARRSADMGITSTSLELLRDVQHLLAGLGVNASLSSPDCWMPDGKLRRRQAHLLTVAGNDQAVILAGLLDMACERKAARLAEYATRTSKQRRSLYDRVVSVEIGEPEQTIAIEVAEWHTHVTGGIVTHNTLYLGGGADVTLVGANLKDLDYAISQGHGEARLAAAAGVPASWVGFSEGLQGSSLNAGNFQAQRRRFSDATMQHLWMMAAHALESVCPPPDSHANLWFDSRVPFMRDDATDIAAIQLQQAQTISALVMQGYDPDSVVKAVANNDMTRLRHSGLMSVQLHPPGTAPPVAGKAPSANGSGQGSGAGVKSQAANGS